MEYLANILTSSNAVPVLVFTLVILVIVLFCVKKGIVSFRGKGLTIGDSISPGSRVKQLCWDTLQAETEIAIRSLPKEYLEEPKKWRTHYVLGKYRDVLELAIMNNNIVSDDEYIESKQLLAYSAVVKATDDDYFTSEDFQNYLNKLTRKIILQFVKIKEKYE